MILTYLKNSILIILMLMLLNCKYFYINLDSTVIQLYISTNTFMINFITC